MVLALFVDGVGLGPGDPAVNPLFAAAYPGLRDLLARAAPLDACLGVPGLPQSATGQVSIFTGLNAAAALGRHLPGFPGPRLRQLLWQDTFYHQLGRRGYRATFLNAFSPGYLRGLASGGAPASATTLAAIAAGLPLRGPEQVCRREALYHDITGEGLGEQGVMVPPLTPAAAAGVARRVALAHDLTLFEFFLTDLAGHRGDQAATAAVLDRLDRFLAALTPSFEPPGPRDEEAGHDYLVVFSDHGNVEDAGAPGHTANPVPLAVWTTDPDGGRLAAGVESITGIAELLVQLCERGGAGGG